MSEVAATLNPEELGKLIADLVRSGVVRIGDFVQAYNRARPPTSPRYAVLDVQAGGDVEAVPEAVRQAYKESFCVALMESLLPLLSDEAAVNDDIRRIVQVLGAKAGIRLQSVLRPEGLRSVKTIADLLRSARATGLITAKVAGTNRRIFGTGFLVGPNLMLTANHVVASLIDNQKARPGSDSDATVVFHNQLDGPGSWPIRCRLTPDWLIAMSPSESTDHQLGASGSGQAAQMLDFALIQLAEPVGNALGVVDIVNAPEPEKKSRLTVIGYTGGSECSYDDHLVEDHDPASHRIHHTVNAVEGMSGGPCIDSEGRAVGLHEGTVTLAMPPYNRAVCLWAIRNQMRNSGRDPLSAPVGRLWSLESAEARRAWIAAGEALLSRVGQDRAEWLATAGEFNPEDAQNAFARDVFHPIFGRADIQDWIDQASVTGSNQRIALISGPKGSGKSFLAAILKARTAATRAPVVVVSPETVQSQSMTDVLNFILRDAGASRADLEASTTRPMAGVLKHDLIPDALAALEAVVITNSPSGLMWLFVDIGESASFTADKARDWNLILTEAEKQRWLRVMMVGLSTQQRTDFATSRNPTLLFSKSLSTVSSDDFLETIGHMAAALGRPGIQWRNEAAAIWQKEVEPYEGTKSVVVEAVMSALMIRGAMLESAGQANGN